MKPIVGATETAKKTFTANNMTQQTRQKLDNKIGNLKITFTDPSSGKQLRVSCKNAVLVSESSQLDIGGSGLDMELFCDNLQFGESWKTQT